MQNIKLTIFFNHKCWFMTNFVNRFLLLDVNSDAINEYFSCLNSYELSQKDNKMLLRGLNLLNMQNVAISIYFYRLFSLIYTRIPKKVFCMIYDIV